MKLTAKNIFSKIMSVTILTLLLSVYVFANGNSNSEKKIADGDVTFRFEHIEFNVADPQAVVKWYTENLGMVVMRSSGAPTYNTFIADTAKNMMLEIGHQEQYPVLDLSKIHHMAMHLAFIVNDVHKVKEKLMAAGATIASDITKSPSGDEILVLRDPWGLPIQFLKRAEQMVKFEDGRFEHFAMNQKDARAKAKWFVDNMGLKIMRQAGEPNYGTFVADQGENMMFELFQFPEYPVIDFSKIDPMSIHIAFTVNNIEAAKEKLLKGGATVYQDINTIPSGDKILIMRDPQGLPLQLIERANPMLK